ncbi:MAG TPA: glycosyltransferase family 4 protein [Planctomycetota bacterium]|nr:glycosyltransferase family 4 protein [Planctomycetota bacterium]
MKILLLSNKVPWPLHDGYCLHNYHYSRQLCARHELHLVSLGEGPVPAELQGIYASTEIVPRRPEPRRRTLASRALHALSADEVHDFDPAVMAVIERVLARERFDLIWTGGAKMLVYSRRIANVPVFGDVADDGVRENWSQMWASRSPASFVRRWRDYASTRRFQIAYFRHCRVVNVVSDADRDSLLEQMPGLEVCVIHNGVDTEYFTPRGNESADPTVVFEGSMGFSPNEEAALYFCREVLPLVREASPGARVLIVGNKPTAEVKAVAGPGVEVTGFVDDVRPYLDKAWVFVCPLLSGTGIKNKILQAWSMKKAVVATAISTGGLVDADANLIVADGKRAFADAVLALFADPARRQLLGDRGRATVLQHYSWEAKARQMESAMAKVAGAKAAARTPVQARAE